AMIGVMMSATKAVTTAAKASPMTMPTAVSTRFPRRRNSLKSFTRCAFHDWCLNHSMALTILNPASEEPIAELDQAGVEETNTAVDRARNAFPAWRAVAPTDRARLL